MDIVKRLIVTHARIEAATTGPCVLAVTSALPTDGCELLASALAQSLLLAGHTVLLVREPLESRDSHSLASAKAAFEVYRQSYDYTIVAASAALSNGGALALTRSADFVVIAFEAGRTARDADRELARTLHATGAALLGVVTLERKTIRSLGKEARAPAPGVRTNTQLDDAAKRSSPLPSTVG